MLRNHRGELYLFSTVVLEHMSAFRLAQIRVTAAFTLLFLFAFIFKREILRISRKEIPHAIAYGIVGFALVNVGYFLGIERGLPLSPKICGLQSCSR